MDDINHQIPNVSILNKSKLEIKTQKELQSFLLRYFHSKEFIFPLIDQHIVNAKIHSLRNFSLQHQNQTKDFKSWILNKYPLNTYFKNIIIQNSQQQNCRILTNKTNNYQHQLQSSKKHKHNSQTQQDKFLNIYIGQTQAGQKHGYGLEIKVFYNQKNSSPQQSQSISSQYDTQVQFTAYEGFYQNNLRHGKGKLFTFLNDSKQPNYYQGKFVNNQTQDSNYCLMIWKNNDFYLGKVKPNFSKQGHGILFISNKLISNQSNISATNGPNIATIINIQNDPKWYDKVVISQWLQNSPKNQSLQMSSSCTLHSLLSQTKIITHNQFYFGQAYVYYSLRKSGHVTVKQGQGQLKMINNDHYMGSFDADLIHGYGKYTWNNSNYYIGELFQGLKHGTGFFKQHATGDQYQGQYLMNKRHGHGQYRWANGNLYHGQFFNQLRQGYGKMVWNTGQVYQGQWKDGLQNGFGKLFFQQKGFQMRFVRQSEFVNGIQMETAQDVSQFPSVLSKKSHFSQTNSKRTFNFLPNETQFKKFRNTSQLPKINQKTTTRFKTQSEHKNKSKTENLEPILEKMKSKIPKMSTQSSKSTKMQRQRSLDYKATQKLPYHRPLYTQSNDKKQITRTASFFESSKKKKTYYVDLQDIRESKQKLRNLDQVREFQTEKKIKDLFSDTLMTPIKWGNIKNKSHQFIFQRKERRPTPPDLTIGRK